MPSLDTNVIARWMIRDVPAQAEKVDAMLVTTPPSYIPDMVFFELEHVMRTYYSMPRDLIAGHFMTTYATNLFELNRAVWPATIELYVKHGSLSLADCYLANFAKASNKAPLITFDKTLAKKLPDLVALAT